MSSLDAPTPSPTFGLATPEEFVHAGHFERQPPGFYQIGIWNTKFASQFAEFTAAWPRLETLMAQVYEEVTDCAKEPERTLLRSVSNADNRLSILRMLIGQRREDRLFLSEAVEEFAALHALYKQYRDGMWWTFQDGRVFVEPSMSKERVPKEMKAADVESFVARTKLLSSQLAPRFSKR
jgi:hypothetical protein